MTTLSRYHSQSLFNFSLLHYPALPLDLLRSGTHVRIPAHSDFGTITLLFQDDTGGLEIADPHSAETETSLGFEKQGKFRPATPIPGTVVVNLGYLLMRWSNGRWKNTVHRVSEPPLNGQCVDEPHVIQAGFGSAGGMAPARYSIPFFSSPDPSTIIEALPGCWSEDMPKRWKPINVGEYLDRKRQGVYT